MRRQAAEYRYRIGAHGLLHHLNLFICIQKTQALFQLQVWTRRDKAVPVCSESWLVLGGAQQGKAQKGGHEQRC